jgi:prolyl-tRNA editing enzyme YbaK/EbsC (Cys-tRNA(Pro) deacylase)
MTGPLSRSARRVQEAIEKRGFDFRVRELPASTRSAKEAAAAVGCDLQQIVKSLVFRAGESDEPVLALVCGDNLVDLAKLAAAGAGALVKADAEFARRHTGFAIGGIPPVGHATPIRTFIDEDLLRLDRVYAAAGTPNALFELDPAELPALTGGIVCDLKFD